MGEKITSYALANASCVLRNTLYLLGKKSITFQVVYCLAVKSTWVLSQSGERVRNQAPSFLLPSSIPLLSLLPSRPPSVRATPKGMDFGSEQSEAAFT